MHPLWEIPTAPKANVSGVCWFPKGVWQIVAWGTLGQYEEMQHWPEANHKHLAAVHQSNKSCPCAGTVGALFHTSVRDWEGYPLSPVLFNILLKWIMSEALEGHQSTESIRGRTTMNLYYIYDIVGLATLEDKLADLINHIVLAAKIFRMPIMLKKNKTDDCSKILWTEHWFWIEKLSTIATVFIRSNGNPRCCDLNSY